MFIGYIYLLKKMFAGYISGSMCPVIKAVHKKKRGNA
jgi:hypothetical protein